VFFWLFHVPSFYVETRSWATTALALGIFLPPHLGSRLITGWLCNGAGSSVLIAGLFHSMHNAIVSSTGLLAVVGLPQFEVLVIMAGIVVLVLPSSPALPAAVTDSTDHHDRAGRREYVDASTNSSSAYYARQFDPWLEGSLSTRVASRPSTGHLGDAPVAVRAVDVELSIDQHAVGQFEQQDLRVVQVRIRNGSDRG
jgi:hypothetical protein